MFRASRVLLSVHPTLPTTATTGRFLNMTPAKWTVLGITGSIGLYLGVKSFDTGSKRDASTAATAAAAAAATATAAVPAASPAPKKGLDPNAFQSFVLKEVNRYNHNTSTFVFDLQNNNQPASIPCASYILTKCQIDGKEVIRPYTPVNQHNNGQLHLLIKKYPQGIMSKFIHSLQPGQTLEIKGPNPKIPYKANMKKSIGMIAGGTGITPMLQVLDEILRNPQDKTQVSLVFTNVSNEDILCKEQLDKYAQNHPNFKVTYLVQKALPGYSGPVGSVNEQTIKKHIPAPSDDSLVFVCGPPGLMRAVSGEKAPDYSQGKLDGMLAKLNYNSNQVFKF